MRRYMVCYRMSHNLLDALNPTTREVYNKFGPFADKTPERVRDGLIFRRGVEVDGPAVYTGYFNKRG